MLAIGLALSVFIVIVKSGQLRRAVEHQAITDIVVTVGLFFIPGGDTLGGVSAAIWGGLFFSLFLFIAGVLVKSHDAVRENKKSFADLFRRRPPRDELPPSLFDEFR